MFWSQGKEQFLPISELFGTTEGRGQFAHWPLKIRDIEEKAIMALEEVIEEEE
jgi:hypothetical protein